MMLSEEALKVEELYDYYNYTFPPDWEEMEIDRAVLEENLDLVKQLIEDGESVNSRDSSNDCTILHLAVIRKNMDILEYLLCTEGIEVDARCCEGRTALYIAAALGYLEIVQRLIQAGADVNIPDIEHNPPLHVAVYHPDVCHLLLRHGARMHVENSRASSLHVAIENECLEAMHMLLYYNADANAIDVNGCTPFMIALLRENVDAQKALLEYVDDFSVTSYDPLFFGSTLCHALANNSPFVKDIIERGGDVNYGDDQRVREQVDAFWGDDSASHGDDLRECAFLACFSRPVDLTTFKMVWERLRYNESQNTIDLLRFLDHEKVVPTFLQVIKQSGNFEPAVKFFSNRDNYFLFVNKFAEKHFDLDQLTVLTCRLLENGFRASSYDIDAIFLHYGYCELFRILLYMDNDFSRGWLPHMVLSRLIFDINYDLKSIVYQVNYIPKDTVLQLLEYSACPHLIDALNIQYSEDETMSAILRNLPRVPSLIELARNAARKQIWQSFKIINTCQFYTTIDHLDMPIIYKNILKFKRKIYRAK